MLERVQAAILATHEQPLVDRLRERAIDLLGFVGDEDPLQHLLREAAADDRAERQHAARRGRQRLDAALDDAADVGAVQRPIRAGGERELAVAHRDHPRLQPSSCQLPDVQRVAVCLRCDRPHERDRGRPAAVGLEQRADLGLVESVER